MRLMACFQANLVMPDEPAAVKKSKPADLVYRIKVTLLGTKPPVWRRVEVRYCTLDELHQHVQTAMRWENSHLHHFRGGDQFYSDPHQMGDNFDDFGYEDSTATRLSAGGPEEAETALRVDFGDLWAHELVVEAAGPPAAGAKYPACVAGGRVLARGRGRGVGVRRLPRRRPEPRPHAARGHGGVGRRAFDPDEFDPAAARRIRKGLPGTRRM